ncbi:MAG: cytochrome C [Burkholderiales bacterium]|nr:cytochrome C [Burkholderiales bacterium]
MSKSVCSQVAAVALAALAFPAVAADRDRGQSLHDNHCVLCHTTSVYTRADRLANTYLEVRQQVQRWQENTRLRWTPTDIDNVTEYIADKYYKLPQ